MLLKIDMIIPRISTYHPKNYNRCTINPCRISFGSGVDMQNSLCRKIVRAGYNLYDEINVIDSFGRLTKALAFVRDDMDCLNKGIAVLITDRNYLTLGEVLGDVKSLEPHAMWCSIKNFTTPNPQMSEEWMKSNFETASGHYRHVGLQAYASLEKYLKERYPEIKMLKVNAENSDSFDFHIKCGFGDPSCLGEYDCYSMTNFLDKYI